MNRITCNVCQQQFKTARGLKWHIGHIHQLSTESVRPGQSSGSVSSQWTNASPRKRVDDASGRGLSLLRNESLEADAKRLYAEISERRETDWKIRGLSEEVRAMKRRVSEIEKTSMAGRVGAREVAGQAEPDGGVHELLRAVLRVLWTLDQPTREPRNLLEMASGAFVSTTQLSNAREVIKSFLRSSAPYVAVRR